MRPPPPVSPGGVPLADFGNRLLAVLVDSAILGAASLVIIIPAFIGLFAWMSKSMADLEVTSQYNSEPDPSQVFSHFFLPIVLFEVGFVLLLLVIYYFYYVEMLYKSGQTIGKKVMKIRVVPLDPTRTLTRGMAAKRYLIEFVVGTFVPFFRYLDGFWQLWDKPYLQTLHDKVAQTVVIKVSP